MYGMGDELDSQAKELAELREKIEAVTKERDEFRDRIKQLQLVMSLIKGF